MPEILTESFCERCGTRYTFESTAPRKTKRLGQFKTLSKGMKNWVMSDDTSLDEAMAAARSDEEREQTSQQLDAFHSTFNFCMNCRQYTCSNCWNPAEGRCLTCAPHLGHEILAAPFPEQAASEPVRIEAEAWPEIDLTVAAADGNGNGAHPDAADPWGAPANELGIEEIDPAARLAFLSGDAVAPTPPPDADPAGPVEAAAAEPAGPLESAAETVPEQASPEPAAASAEPAAAPPASPAPGGWSDTFFRDARATEPTPAEPPPVQPAPRPVAPPVAADATPATPTAAPAAAAPVVAASAGEPALPAAEPLPPTVEGRAVAGATRTSDLLRRFRPGQSLDAELAAFEAELERGEAVSGIDETPAVEVAPADAAAEPVAAEPKPEPVAAEALPEPVVAELAAVQAAPEPEPVTAVPEPEPEPLAAVAEHEPVAVAPEPEPVVAAPEPEPEPVAAAPEPEPVRDDRIEQPTWRIYAPDGSQPAPTQPPAPVPSLPTPPANGNGAPQWPVRPEQVDSPAMALLANRGNGGANADLWAASAREVLAQPGGAPKAAGTTGVQPCTNCGLSLSATARFCRRCGTRQG